ncbi:hypothetical protein ACIBQ1_20765 [Nonomuraea sp. NPDC050153]|uniref:hypothetical protein n=1 Tax=Nonomuraea sp. NPDC050153 TaxID=3364359 RepID=UPI0037A6EA4C
MRSTFPVRPSPKPAPAGGQETSARTAVTTAVAYRIVKWPVDAIEHELGEEGVEVVEVPVWPARAHVFGRRCGSSA